MEKKRGCLKWPVRMLLTALLCGAVLFAHPISRNSNSHPAINPDGSINPASWAMPYTPKAGDVIRCGDGTNYVIIRANDDTPPPLEADAKILNTLPEAEANHLEDISGDYLFLRNLPETSRMVSSLSKLLGDETSSVQPLLPENADYIASHSWDAEWAASVPGKGAYGVEAWDIFKDGEFLWTVYLAAKVQSDAS